MSQGIRSVGERAKAICGAEAKNHLVQAENIKREARLRVLSAFNILSAALEVDKGADRYVQGDVCMGVQFLCKDSLRACDELMDLGFLDAEEPKAFLVSAIAILEYGLEADCLTGDTAFGAVLLLNTAEDKFEELSFVKAQNKKTTSSQVLQ